MSIPVNDRPVPPPPPHPKGQGGSANDGPLEEVPPMSPRKGMDGGPAFPVPMRVIDCRNMTPEQVKRAMASVDTCNGIAVRDYLAARALQGLLANGRCPIDEKSPEGWSNGSLARMAYKLADAMLEERKRFPDSGVPHE